MTGFDKLLFFTILESVPALTVCTANFGVNLLWLWLNSTPEVDQPSFVFAHGWQGYGFWAAAWAIAAYTVSTSKEQALRKRFARLASVLYLVWWPMWYEALLSSSWKWYVLFLYSLVRGIQALGYTYYGFLGGAVGGHVLKAKKRE